MDQVLPLTHPDMVRKLQPLLHRAAEAHRFHQEHIDASSPNCGSVLGKQVVYLTKVMILKKAIEDLIAEQEAMRDMAFDATDAARDAAITNLFN